ncbi:MAG TPA: 5-formyltetrahydrofolate cyclo-ligase [Xanthobacteraceae bacterium]|nr:5-formyltetrahydrofolate cyclo-ligase [Xanthobacteraceae bacterium]
MPSDIAETKRSLRNQALARRDQLDADYRQRAAEAIAQLPFPVPVPKGTIVSGFFPMKTELSLLPLMRALEKNGAQIALPRIIGRGNPLSMRAWKFGDPLLPGQWGIREPAPDAPEVDPDILLVPFAAFDRRGYRVGYGAGYYDRTIAGLKAKKKVVTIGFGLEAQEVDACPVEAHDQKLDFLITEKGLRVGQPERV